MAPEQFGPYLVYEELGVGGMATVHRAEIRGVEGFSKPVALKRMHPHLAAYPETVKAFVREAQLASHLHHGNIAQTFELGKAGNTYFISMEYIPGPTLTQVMRQCQRAAGAIPPRIAIAILLQLCDALDYAHNRTDDNGRPLGIIHRDVSPSNIVISNTGIVKLLDFGVAKVSNKKDDTDTPLSGITIKGKFDYIAPEYLGGTQLDARADLFAVGVIAHELLTGRKLFDGADDFETTTKVLEMVIQPPSRWSSAVDYDLDQIVLKALWRDPDRRWQTANALHTALMEYGHRSKALATSIEVLEWVRWAFSQVRDEGESGKLAQVIDMLDQPSSAELILTPDQHRELNEFDQPLATLHGVGSVSAKPTNPSLIDLHGARISMGPMTVVPPQGTPAAMTRPPPPLSRPSAFVPQQIAAPRLELRGDESGVVVALARPRRRWSRIVAILLLFLVAAGAGVAFAAYLLDLELPVVGRL